MAEANQKVSESRPNLLTCSQRLPAFSQCSIQPDKKLKLNSFLLHLQPMNVKGFYSCCSLVCLTKYKCHCSYTPLCSPVPFWKDGGGRWSIILTRLKQWLRWSAVSSMFELNSIKLKGNPMVIASRLHIRNLKSQPIPPVQFSQSLGEKAPWHQCPASALPLHTPAQRAGTAEPQSWQEQNLWHSTLCVLNRIGN